MWLSEYFRKMPTLWKGSASGGRVSSTGLMIMPGNVNSLKTVTVNRKLSLDYHCSSGN